MIKKITTIVLCILSFSSFSYGQITTTKIGETSSTEKQIVTYDSINNYLDKKALLYIGQEFYVKGMKEDFKRKNGYRNFYSNLNPKTYYKVKFVYDSATPYEVLYGKYLKVLDVKQVGDKYSEKFIFTLQDKETNDVLYYDYTANSLSMDFPFIVVGFFEKYKKDYVGKEFVFPYQYFEGSADYQTNKPITNRVGQKWKCIDITVDEKDFNVNLVFQNSLGEKDLVVITETFKNYFAGYTVQEANKYIAKFGQANFNLILKGEVRIGMTPDMCKLSWGEPKDINTTTTQSSTAEQWVYDRNYLYFRNGRLTTIQ